MSLSKFVRRFNLSDYVTSILILLLQLIPGNPGEEGESAELHEPEARQGHLGGAGDRVGVGNPIGQRGVQNEQVSGRGVLRQQEPREQHQPQRVLRAELPPVGTPNVQQSGQQQDVQDRKDLYDSYEHYVSPSSHVLIYAFPNSTILCHLSEYLLDGLPVYTGRLARQIYLAVVVAAVGDDVVLPEHVEVVPHRFVVEVEVLGQLVGVARPLVQRLEDARAVRTAARPREHVPESGLHRPEGHARPM